MLTDEARELQHYFNDRIASARRISLYGDARFRMLDISRSHASQVYLLRPLDIEKFTCEKMGLDISFLSLSEDTYELSSAGIADGQPAIAFVTQKLMRLDLRGAKVKPSVLNTYLKALVTQHYGRRNLTAYFSTIRRYLPETGERR